MTGTVGFVGRELVRGWDRSDYSSAIQEAEEIALVQCLDDAGEHWTQIIDGAVFRAAVSGMPEEVHPGDTGELQKNWWVDRLAPEHILVLRRGWEEDWKRERRDTTQ